MINFQRGILLLTGLSLIVIGALYCIDPNTLLARYELSADSASTDNMYRGAYGGLFLTLGASIGAGGFAASFRQTATLIALLFMGGFAMGRLASIITLGMPHPQIFNLLVVELVSVIVFAWFFMQSKAPTKTEEEI